ncbi:MAG: hypothetical protein ACTSYI_04600 [Promethearchaeota archaeon]
MCPSPLVNLLDLSDPLNERLYRFLDYVDRIEKSTGAPYVRNLVLVDYLTTSLMMSYPEAERFLSLLQEEDLLTYDQHGAFPGAFLSIQGGSLLSELKSIFGPISTGSPLSYIPEKKTYVWGKTQDPTSGGKVPIKEIFDEILYRFFKFHLGVIRRTKVPYLRELVAEDYLSDIEHLTFNQANKLIADLVEKGYLEYDQFGAFPGTGVTKKGNQYFEQLQAKLTNIDIKDSHAAL